MIKEYFRIAVRNLRVRSMRSWLTIIGIVIGIFLVISLVSLSEGMKNTIMSELDMMGGNLIMVVPGDISDMMTTLIGGLELEDRDIDAIKRVRGVDAVLEMPWTSEMVRHEQETSMSLLYGISYDSGLSIVREDMGWDVVEGRFPYSGRREVMVGNLVPKDVFPNLQVGDQLTIKGGKFTVTGIMRSLGNREDDLAIPMDLSDFRSITGKREGTPIAIVRVAEGYDIESVERDITYALEDTRIRGRGEDSPSFSVLSSDAVSDIVGNIMGVLQIAVFAFASISIIVGGIGITNTMYTSVRERTREIGILKAVGAKRNHITSIFLVESGIIGLIGGVGGVLLGVGLAKGVEFYIGEGSMFPIEAHISPSLILFGLIFSFLIGCVSGFLPARAASRMQPVDALRYE